MLLDNGMRLLGRRYEVRATGVAQALGLCSEVLVLCVSFAVLLPLLMPCHALMCGALAA